MDKTDDVWETDKEKKTQLLYTTWHCGVGQT